MYGNVQPKFCVAMHTQQYTEIHYCDSHRYRLVRYRGMDYLNHMTTHCLYVFCSGQHPTGR